MGNIIRSFAINLFSSPGKVKPGEKVYPHTTGEIGSPADFTAAKISDGEDRTNKVWAVSIGKVFRGLFDLSSVLEEDASEELGEVGDFSDILSVGDGNNEDIISTELNIPVGSGAFSITGEGANTMWGQSFESVGGPFESMSLAIRKVGSPADELRISIQEDDSDAPDGVSIIEMDRPAADFADSFEDHVYEKDEWNPDELQLEVGKKYWIVFERTGSASETDYYMVRLDQSATDPYERGELKSFNGSDWTRMIFRSVIDTFTSDGTWQVPALVTEAQVEAWAAGAGGSTNVGAGGGGAYAKSILTGLTPMDNKAVVVGTSAVDTDGTDSTFDTSAVVAKGGKSGTNGGQGGTAAASTGSVKFSGGDGSIGTGNRGAGGGAGTKSDGSGGSDQIPGFGGNDFGGQGGGTINDVHNGGRQLSGGGNSSATEEFPGARGEVRITYTVPVPDGFPFVMGRSVGRFISGIGPGSLKPPITTYPGDLLIAVVSSNGSNPSTSVPGWTRFAHRNQSTDVSQSLFYRRATGDDSSQVTGLGGSNFANWIVLQVVNGGIPTASQASGASSNANPPNHAGGAGKSLWIACGSWDVSDNITVSAPPTDYGSFLVNPESTPDATRDARTAVAERLLEASSENPGAFTSSGEQWVAGTISVPFEEQEIFIDASVSIAVKFPAAEERIYVSGKEDVKFLNEEDGTWQSLWRGICQKDPLDGTAPHPMKNMGSGGTVLLGDGNKLHTFIATATSPNDAREDRLVFDPIYSINWIAVGKSSVFIGLRHKESAFLPSQICYYEPFSEYTRIFTISEGETVGWMRDENCEIIDKSGRMRAFTGSGFRVFDYWPTHFKDGTVDFLPHRNGVKERAGTIEFLWKGQYPYPAGIWAYENGNLYHRKTLVFDGQTLNSYGAIEGVGDWRALFNAGRDQVMGASVSDGTDPVEGIFSTKNISEEPVSEETRGNFTTSKMSSNELDDIFHNVAVKYDAVPGGKIMVKQKLEPLSLPINEEESFSGAWSSINEFTCSDAAFVSLVDDGRIVPGDEVVVRKGMGAGLLAHIQSMTGAATKTITLDEGFAAVSSGSFEFSIEKWSKVDINAKDTKAHARRALKDPRLENAQLKVEIRGNTLEEIQLKSAPNNSINN